MFEDHNPAHEDLIAREQMAYLEQLRALRVPASEGLALLDLAPDVAPVCEDAVRPSLGRHRGR